LRGLGEGRYAVTDYWTAKPIGVVSQAANRLSLSFENFLLLEVTPLARI